MQRIAEKLQKKGFKVSEVSRLRMLYRFLEYSRIECILELLETLKPAIQLPTYLAYRLLATAVSVVPLMIALPSGKSVISNGSFQNLRTKAL